MLAGKKRKPEEQEQIGTKRPRLSSSDDTHPPVLARESMISRVFGAVGGFLRRFFSRSKSQSNPLIGGEQSFVPSEPNTEDSFRMDKQLEADLLNNESQLLMSSSSQSRDHLIPPTHSMPVLFQSNLTQKLPTSTVDVVNFTIPSSSPSPRVTRCRQQSVLDGVIREKEDAMFRQMISGSSLRDGVSSPGKSLLTPPTSTRSAKSNPLQSFTLITGRRESMSSTSIQSSTKYLSSGPSSVPVSHNHQTNSPIPGIGIRLYSTTIASKRSLPSKGPPGIVKHIPCVTPPLPRDPSTSLKSTRYLHRTDSHVLSHSRSSVEPVPLLSPLAFSVHQPESSTHPHSHSSNPEQLSFSPISTVSPRTPTNLQDAFKLTDWLNQFSSTHSLKMLDFKARKEVLDKYTKICQQERMEAEDRRNQKLIKKLNDMKVRPWTPSLEEEEPELCLDLSEDAMALVNKVWSDGPLDEVFTERKNIRITRRDLLTLKGLEWLNDEVINFYLGLVVDIVNNSGKRKVHLFNTFFYPKIMSAGYSGVRRWTKKVDIFSFDIILLPVHLGMHWCLACIDFTKKQICYYDSFKGSNPQCLRVLRDYLVSEAKDKKQEVYDVSDWKLECRQDVPEQHNGSDCGVFTCMYARHLARDKPMKFSQSDLPAVRSMMVAEIIYQRLMTP